MKPERLRCFLWGVSLALIIATIIWIGIFPQFDDIVSRIFYRANEGFFLADLPLFRGVHWLATTGARILGVWMTVVFLTAWIKRKPIFTINAKGWLFLCVALVLIPVLVVNAGFKDHWDRARPRETVEFGGTAVSSAALIPQIHGHANGSFVAGDPAFAFFLTAFAYVVPQRQSRRIFWIAVSIGSLTGLARIAMGGHYFSDVVYAAVIVLALSAVLHGLFFNFRLTFARWRAWVSNTQI